MHRLVSTLDAVSATRSRKDKVARLAEFLRGLDDTELAFAARFVVGQVLPTGDGQVLGVGWALLSAAAAKVTGVGEPELASRARERGDFGAALESLWPARVASLALGELPTLVAALAGTTDRARKLAVLVQLFSRATAGEAKYLGKALLGELRVGVQRGTLEEALAQAFSAPADAVRHAAALTVDPGALALLAKHGRLASATVTVGHVIASMLATPVEVVKEPVDLALTVAEDKLDGIRTQAHVVDGRVRLFGRGQEDITASFPEVVERLRALPRPTVLDGEIIAVTAGGQVRPFQALQARLGRVKPTASIRQRTPVQFVAFDVMFDGRSLLDQSWAARRERLEQVLAPGDGVPTTPANSAVRLHPYVRLDPSRPLDGQLDALFAEARARGHEGLMLKRTDAPYEAGHRGSAWRKVKRAFATLDCVITKAERGHGKRAGVLSDYTFAVWRGDELVDIGKAYSGLTDAEIAQLTARLEASTVRRQGVLHEVEPSVVLEIAFDGLQPSKRHPSGWALRFPRIVRIRDDKTAADADRLETAQALFDQQVGTGHREEPEEPPQLDLFT